MTRPRVTRQQLEAVAGVNGHDAPASPAPPNGTPYTPPADGDRAGLVEAARRSLSKLPDAVEGDHGSDRTFNAAALLTRDWALADAEALPLLRDYNHARCKPPWSDEDLLRKLQQGREKGKNEAGCKARRYFARPAANGAPPAEEPPELVYTKFADIEELPIEWLWLHWLPKGAISILDGDPGVGKSTLTADLMARVSRGWAMPPAAGAVGEPGGVILLSDEDDPRRTIKPRLRLAGADVNRVELVRSVRQGGTERGVVLDDLERLPERVASERPALVIVDPLMAYVGGEYDCHKDQDIRRCLRRLGLVAERLGTVVLLIRHLNKLNGGAALYRGGGSIGIIGSARSGMVVGRDPEDAGRRVLAMNKSNLGPLPRSLAYELQPNGQHARIAWVGECDLKPDDILFHGQPHRPEGRPPEKRAEAEALLRRLLDVGAVPVTRIRNATTAAGIGWKTVERAKDEIGAQAIRQCGEWYWGLPVGDNGIPD